MTDSKNLKALCEAAPTGPWLVENDSLYFKDDGYTRHLLDADAGHDVEDEAYYAALNFIVAANPAAILALIAENERLERLSLDSVNAEYAANMDLESIFAERDQLKAENEALRKERDKLAEENRGLLEDFAGLL